MSSSNNPPIPAPETPEEAQKEFERLFAELVDVLQMTVDGMDKSENNLPRDLDARLSSLEQQVAQFQAIHADVAKVGLGEKVNLDHTTLQEQACIERSKDLMKDADEKLKNFAAEGDASKNEITDEKERKRHFKRLGRKKI